MLKPLTSPQRYPLTNGGIDSPKAKSFVEWDEEEWERGQDKRGIRHGVFLDVRDRGGNRGPMFPQGVQWASFGTLRWIHLRLGRNLHGLESRSLGVVSGRRSLGASDRNFQTAASQKQIRGMDADMKPARRNE